MDCEKKSVHLDLRCKGFQHVCLKAKENPKVPVGGVVLPASSDASSSSVKNVTLNGVRLAAILNNF